MGGQVRGRGDDRHEPSTPTIPDVIGHRHRRVADASREVLRQKRGDRTVDHPHVRHEHRDHEDGHQVADMARLNGRPQRRVEREVRDRGQEEAGQDDRLAADAVRQRAEQHQRRRGDQERGPHDQAGLQHVHMLDRLQVVQRPELAAVPHAPLSDHDDARDQHVLDVAAKERLPPRVGRGLPFRLHRLEDRRLLEA